MIGDLINIIKLSIPDSNQSPQRELALGAGGLLVSASLIILAHFIPTWIPPLQYNPVNPVTALAPLTNAIVPWMVIILKGSAALITGFSIVRIGIALFRIVFRNT